MISLLFNMLSIFVVTFLPRGKCPLISWLQLKSAVIFEPKKIKSVTVSSSPSIFKEVNLYAEYIMRNTGLEETSWNQDCWEKYQSPQICKWHHPYGRRWRTQEPLVESERVEWKSWLKDQHFENWYRGIWSHQFMGNRWGNSGNSGWLYLSGLQNHCRWWLQPWN